MGNFAWFYLIKYFSAKSLDPDQAQHCQVWSVSKLFAMVISSQQKGHKQKKGSCKLRPLDNSA